MTDPRPAGSHPGAGPDILVVCTGNVCRSPMAEALLRHHLSAAGLALSVHSAGTLGWNSAGPTDHTLTALTERGVELDGHISRRMNAQLIAPAQLIITMTNDHMDAVRNHHEPAAARTFVLGQLVRLAEKHGPRDDRSLGEWVAALDEFRAVPRRRARPQEEIRDPLGEPLEAYQELAAQLEDLTIRLVRRLGAPQYAGSDSGVGMSGLAPVGQDGPK